MSPSAQPNDASADSAIGALCEHLAGIHAASCAAFSARMRVLTADGIAPPAPRAEGEWWCFWYDRLIQLLLLDADDPRLVSGIVETLRWSPSNAPDVRFVRASMQALVWACRDVAPTYATPAVIAELEARGAMVAAVARRLTPP